jgi:hypothetical protein
VLLHRFPINDVIGIIMLEIERISGLRATELNLGDVGEKLGHRRGLTQFANLTIGTDTQAIM